VTAPDDGAIRWQGHRPLGCVLVHGFTATPEEVRPLGEALSAAGFRALAIRLPGHATSVADLGTVGRRQWLTAVEAGVREMAEQTQTVALAGVSLGALLSLAVAAAGSPRVQALALLGTPLRLADERAAMLRYVAWVPGLLPPSRLVRKRQGRDILDAEARTRSVAYDAFPLTGVVELLRLRAAVRRGLRRVTQPTLLLHGRHDRTAPIAGLDELRRRLASKPLEVTIFEQSAHVLTEDGERDAVATRVVEFLSRCERG
jgi:carboxylesterase